MRVELRGWSKLTNEQRHEIGKLFTDAEKYYKISISRDDRTPTQVKGDNIVQFHSAFIEHLYTLERDPDWEQDYIEFLQSELVRLKWEADSDHKSNQAKKRYSKEEVESRKDDIAKAERMAKNIVRRF